MKSLLVFLAALALAGCANRNYGSWLEQVGRLPIPRNAMSDQEASELTARAVKLRAEADAIRTRLNSEPDRVQRFREYADLRLLDNELAPIEQRLTNAGRSSRERTGS